MHNNYQEIFTDLKAQQANQTNDIKNPKNTNWFRNLLSNSPETSDSSSPTSPHVFAEPHILFETFTEQQTYKMPETVFGQMQYNFSTVHFFKLNENGEITILNLNTKNVEDNFKIFNKNSSVLTGIVPAGDKLRENLLKVDSLLDEKHEKFLKQNKGHTANNPSVGSTQSNTDSGVGGVSPDNEKNLEHSVLLQKNLHYLDSFTFLQACKNYVKLLDMLGPASKIVKKDVNNNINKLERFIGKFCDSGVQIEKKCVGQELGAGSQDSVDAPTHQAENSPSHEDVKRQAMSQVTPTKVLEVEETHDYSDYGNYYYVDQFYNQQTAKNYVPEPSKTENVTSSFMGWSLFKTGDSQATENRSKRETDSHGDSTGISVSASSETLTKCIGKNCNLFSIIFKELLDDTTDITNPNKSHKKFHETATDALVWLKRGLWCIEKFFENMLRSEEKNPSLAFQLAYDETLRKYHDTIVGYMVSTAMSLTPKYETIVADACSVKSWWVLAVVAWPN